jgi:hypothetical protein
MIPTLILFGLIFGRWWRSALIVGAVGWPVLLLATGTASADADLIGVAGLALANTGVGVAVHQGVLWGARRYRRAIRPNAPDRRNAPRDGGDHRGY